MKSNIHYFLFFVLFFIIQNVKSQTDDGVKKSYIPNISIATPQVASMSKVNEIPVDIATGRINYTIPIFEIKEGEFTMPINLSYNYSGLLVDETPGYAGVGWTFNIGGAVMHIIKGLNDEEHLLERSMMHNYFNKLPPYQDENLPESKARILDLFEKIAEGKIDGRPDKYSINIGNISCSFYLDKDDNPIFMKNENYKLVKNGSSGFTLTDDKGINYIFSLPQINKNTSSSSEGYSYNSSFLIKEINFPHTSNKITFYYADPNTLYDIYDSYTSANTIINYYNNWSTTKSRTETSSSVTKLSKITTDNYTIELQYDDNPTELAVAVVTKLEIKNKAGIAIKTYDFSYSQWSGRRKNLLDLKYNGQVINSMEYDESLAYPNFSEGDLAKKDLWGYYNSTGSLPLSNAPVNPLDNPGIKPNFTSTQIGSLKKITYQTKGYSIIEYEPNTVFMNVADYNLPYSDEKGGNTSISATTTNIGGTRIDTLDIVTIIGELKIYNKLSNDPTVKGWENRTSSVILYKEGERLNPIFERSQLWTKDGHWMPEQSSFINQASVSINSPGRYFLEATSSEGSMAHVIATYQQPTPPSNQTVGGIRVKQVKNCDFNGACIMTTYNYSQSGKSIGIILQKPQFYSGSFFTDRTNCLPANDDTSSRTYYYSYNSISPLSNFRGSPVLYKKVEQIEGNLLENNGRTVFLYSGGGVNFLHDEGYNIGQLDQKNILSKTGDTIQKQKNTYLNNVERNNRRFVLGLECKLTRTTFNMYGGFNAPLNCSPILPRPLSDFVTETFTHESKNYFLEKEDHTSYFNGRTLIQNTVNSYDSETGNLKNQVSTNSNGEDLRTQYFYITDSEMANEPFRNELVAKKMVGKPIKTQSFNGEKISEQKIEYRNDGSTSNLLLPKYVYANKGVQDINNLKDKKITYDQYDEKGNVLQYTVEGGLPVAIIWGYNKTQPIAKVENASYDQISSYVSNLQNRSDLDDDNCLTEDCNEQILRNNLKTLRTSFPQFMITTYTYNPLLGVTSVTDPKGVPSYYEYDAVGRLKFVKDYELNVLQKYCYNYKGQLTDCSDNTSTSEYIYKSAARSGTFTKKNCAAGGTGQSVTYNQARGAVTSTISQADADSKGLTKFNTEGQVYANANGACIFYSAAISRSIAKNNCAVGGTGSSVSYSQTYGAEHSFSSQAEADSKGLSKFNTEGQVYANANGTCIFYSAAISRSIAKNNCAVGGTGSSVPYSQAYGAEHSFSSQAEADSKGLSKFNTEGQAYANANGTCTFYSAAISGSIAKNNCAAGGTGSSVPYSQAYGAEHSFSSQAEADSKGLSKFNTEGQAYANANGTCTFYSAAISGSITKNNCAVGGTGSSVPYSQTYGAEHSFSSQAEADSKGLSKFNTEGQAYANANGTCTFYSAAISGSIAKNNCAAGGTGSSVPYSQSYGAEYSFSSQADADNRGLTKFNTEGQVYANANGYCTFYSVAISRLIAKNDCTVGGEGSSVPYSQIYGAERSFSSQAEADSKGLAKFNTEGQVYANANGKCTFYSIAYSDTFTNDECGLTGTGTNHLYTLAARAEKSEVSQGEANYKAVLRFLAEGQIYANTEGSCVFNSAPLGGYFLKNSCPAGTVSTSGPIYFEQSRGTVTSKISQANADELAVTKFNTDGLNYANAVGECFYYSAPISGSFTKTNCPPGGIGSTNVYSVGYGAGKSKVSQVEADAQALEQLNYYGKVQAEYGGTCTYLSQRVVYKIYKNDYCPPGTTFPYVYYIVEQGKYDSEISQVDADNKAWADVSANAQAYANTNGICLRHGEVEE